MELSDSQQDTLRQELGRLQAELEQLLATSSAGAQIVDLDKPIGRLTRMDAMQQQQMNKANRRAVEIRVQQIKAAIRRMDDQSYGYCLSCDEPISAARLKVRPEAPLCIGCQGQRER